jgi:hypothetical protein
MSNTLRLDINNPKDRQLLERATSDGKPAIKAYFEKRRTVESIALEQGLISEPLKTEEKKDGRSHYGNEIFEADGIRWQSTHEYNVWLWLNQCLRAGVIIHLKRQIKYPLVWNGIHISTPVLDFQYVHVPTSTVIVADAKSEFTVTRQRWKLQKKMLKACYNIDVLEIISGKPYQLI